MVWVVCWLVLVAAKSHGSGLGQDGAEEEVVLESGFLWSIGVKSGIWVYWFTF